MSDFEMILMMLLIPLYGLLFYIAGKANLFELMIKSAEEKLKEIMDDKEK